MIITISWLKEHLKTKANEAKIIEQLTNIGLEDENVGEMVDEYGTRWNPIVRLYDTNW